MPTQLMDIRGLDEISWWPPAAGWWISTLLMLVALTALFLLIRHLFRYPPGSWRWEAQAALRELRRQRNQISQKAVAARLSELLRRIAIARFGREKVASITGNEWLTWLQQTDPLGFEWSKRGGILIDLPYAPDDRKVNSGELDALILAALKLAANRREDVVRWWKKVKELLHV